MPGPACLSGYRGVVSTLAILTAAGSGTRLGLDLPKALAVLGGVPLVVHAARRLAASGAVDAIVVTAPAGFEEAITALLTELPSEVPVRVVLGGSTRQASVAAGLAQAPPDADIVLVHDAARPLVPPELIARVVESVRAGHRAVVPGLPVTDTLKRVLPGGSVEPVAATVERAPLRAVQTPQGFDRELLELAHAAATHRSADESTAATDDAGLVEALGEPVVVVAGDERAAKITTAHDLRVATLTLQEER